MFPSGLQSWVRALLIAAKRKKRLLKSGERIRTVIASLSDLETELHEIEIEFAPTESQLPNISRFVSPILQAKLDLDENRIREWQSEFDSALTDTKTLDASLYMGLLEARKIFVDSSTYS